METAKQQFKLKTKWITLLHFCPGHPQCIRMLFGNSSINIILISKIISVTCKVYLNYIFSSVQLLSHVRLFVTLWTTAHQVCLSITNCQSLHKPMFIESVMPSNHLILCRPLLLLSIFPSIMVFSNESDLCIRWPKYWSLSFSISPSNEYSGLISFLGWTGLISLQSKGLSRVFSNITVQKHQFFSTQLSL